MCGIVGFWSTEELQPAVAQGIARKMSACIRHRGPDDEGFWIDSSAGLVFAHRRLSIIDLSPAGHQPMVSHCGRFVLVFNGEIYNHRELRAELEKAGAAPRWRGHSDTETLLAALANWGVPQTLKRINGMFAFALWDCVERTLWLARDRMGEKPLYYGRVGKVFLFGSELKALRAHPSWCTDVDRDVLCLYLRHGYIPAPWSIYKDIYKLPPAHYLVVRDGGQTISEPQCYWDIRRVAEVGIQNPLPDTPELIDLLEERLRDAVISRMEADVPLGAFLSGGIDSSIVVALMQASASHPVRTFTIGFYEHGYNEAEYAKQVAQHLGTDHMELYVTPVEARDVIPKIPEIWDEPFADPSQIPTFLLAKLTRQHVVVSLSGDGGDELFGGYNRYAIAVRFLKYRNVLPPTARKFVGAFLENVFSANSIIVSAISNGSRVAKKKVVRRIQGLAQILRADSPEEVYRWLVSRWKLPDHIVIGAKEPETIFQKSDSWPDPSTFLHRIMWLDQITYLPDDILVKVDRASMAVSLESRAPLLDHRLVEFSWRVPLSAKLRDGEGKWLLKQVLYRYVPKELVDRPKQGFGVPLEHWLRGPLREWAESLLAERRLRQEGFFKPDWIRCLWEQHLAGVQDWQYYLWNILMFQAWLETQTTGGQCIYAVNA